MGKIRTSEDLDVWQMSKNLTLKIYEITGQFPRDEAFGITSQIKRAALSVPSNIAEGFGRFHFMDKAKFYLNARGSLYELKSHVLIAKELGVMNDEMANSVFQEIDGLSLMLNNLIKKTRSMKEGR